MDLTDDKHGKLLDHIGEHILEELQRDGRLPMSRLGKRVGLSTPAVAERVRKMEEAGIITGYHAHVRESPDSVTAFIHVNTPPQAYPRVLALLEENPRVVECHHMSGEDAFIIKVGVEEMAQIESLVKDLSRHGTTRTHIVLSSPILRRSAP